MKLKVSISVEEDTMVKVESKVQTGIFRNKSHLIEQAVKEYLKEGKNGSN